MLYFRKKCYVELINSKLKITFNNEQMCLEDFKMCFIEVISNLKSFFLMFCNLLQIKVPILVIV